MGFDTFCLIIVKKVCSFPVLLDEPGNFCYNPIRRGSSRRKEKRVWIDILGFTPVQTEMTRLLRTGQVSLIVTSVRPNLHGGYFFMGIGELLLLAVGVSMDAFAVSICKGLAMKKATQ